MYEILGRVFILGGLIDAPSMLFPAHKLDKTKWDELMVELEVNSFDGRYPMQKGKIFSITPFYFSLNSGR
jgi:hypothetical protein